MRGKNLIILVFAVLLGLVAVFLANTYFSGVEEREDRVAQENQLERIVVATQDMAFGTQITQTNVKMVSWPSSSIPNGSFTDISEAVKGGRVALRPITVGEPVLASKVSGDDGRATLAALLPEGQRAVSVPVNAVAGVAGFVRAGDVVDVLLTRQIPGEGAQPSDKMTTVILESAMVLAVDQTKDENDTQAVVAKTATLQTDLYGAQKLTLAQQIGTLSLALRNVENQTVGATDVVLANDLGGSNFYIGPRNSAPAPSSPVAASYRPPARASSQASVPAVRRYRGPTMTIVKGVEGAEVPVRRSRGW